LCATKQRAEAALATLQSLLAELGLELAAAKTRIVELRTGEEGFDFLGYHYRVMPTRRNRSRTYAACWPSKASVAAAKERVRALVPYSRVGRPTIMVVEDLNAFLRGWRAYYRHGNSTQQFKALDRFVFERLARFEARKRGSRNWRRGTFELLKSDTILGLNRLAGTVSYPTAHAAR
jgi:hypothetical protein